MKKITLLVLFMIISGCQSLHTVVKNKNSEVNPALQERQELSTSHDWVWAGDIGKGAIALKKDGSFWKFGKVGFNWGGITFPPSKKDTYIYHLNGKKIADGFKDAKIIHGGYTLYAIKKDGILWAWKGGNERFIQLTSTNNWLTAGSKDGGNGCNSFEIGLKKDGSIWDLYDIDKIKRIGSQKGFTKVAFGCATIYAQKRDGTIYSSYWIDNENVDLKKLIKKKKGADVYEKEALLEFVHLKSGVVGNHIDTVQYGKLVSDIKIKKDGTLWLTPEVKVNYDFNQSGVI